MGTLDGAICPVPDTGKLKPKKIRSELSVDEDIRTHGAYLSAE